MKKKILGIFTILILLLTACGTSEEADGKEQDEVDSNYDKTAVMDELTERNTLILEQRTKAVADSKKKEEEDKEEENEVADEDSEEETELIDEESVKVASSNTDDSSNGSTTSSSSDSSGGNNSSTSEKSTSVSTGSSSSNNSSSTKSSATEKEEVQEKPVAEKKPEPKPKPKPKPAPEPEPTKSSGFDTSLESKVNGSTSMTIYNGSKKSLYDSLVSGLAKGSVSSSSAKSQVSADFDENGTTYKPKDIMAYTFTTKNDDAGEIVGTMQSKGFPASTEYRKTKIYYNANSKTYTVGVLSLGFTKAVESFN